MTSGLNIIALDSRHNKDHDDEDDDDDNLCPALKQSVGQQRHVEFACRGNINRIIRSTVSNDNTDSWLADFLWSEELTGIIKCSSR